MEDSQSKKKPRRVKGCYNCSQRRVNCDRGDPCQKCVKKGLECSGLGVRYRFNNGVASRGRLAGKCIPIKDTGSVIGPPTSGRPQCRELVVSSDSTSAQNDKNDTVSSTEMSLSSALFSLDHLDRRSRFLLEHFSSNVSPAMAAINTIFNGYRDLILPMSELDDVVRNSVMAASASHLSLQHPEFKLVATNYHMAAIKGLNQRLDGDQSDHSLAYSSISTMILLLVEEMITAGTRDFHILLRMVKSFIEAHGGEDEVEKTPLGRFLVQQVRKSVFSHFFKFKFLIKCTSELRLTLLLRMTLYSAPLISEILAVETLQNFSRRDLGCLYSHLEIYPEYSTQILKIADLIRSAVNVYLARACKASDEQVAMLVQRFLEDTSTFNADSFGGHILIWPFFIVGAECSLEKDREFVKEQLRSLWRATGFRNTLYAIELLSDIWQGKYKGDLAHILVERVEGFIM